MSKFLYPIYKLNIESYKKWWLYHKKAGGSGILSEILEGFSFNLENTLNRKFNLFEIKGNSTQETTTGKNLLPNNATTQTYFGITITKKDDGTLILNGTATDIIQLNLLNNKRNNSMLPEADTKYSLESGIYKLSGCNNGSKSTYKLDVWVDGAEGLTATCFNQEVQFTLDEEKIVSYLRLVVYSGVTLNNVVIKPMVRLASVTDDTYEPYTGGIASPNPNYEQPILSSGDNGSINERITNSDGTEEQDYSIPTQQPFRSIGDVRDCFVNVNGNWFERHYIKYLDLAISAMNNSENYPGWKNVQQIKNDFPNINTQLITKTSFLCNIFEKTSRIMIINTIGNNSILYLDKSLLNLTQTQWKENYPNLVLKLGYISPEPLDLPCTPEQVEQLENLPSTYKDFTIIQSQDETPAYLKIQYYKEG